MTKLYSARSALACFYDTISRFAGEGGLAVSYMTYPSGMLTPGGQGGPPSPLGPAIS
jgi:hypothetical protein